MKSLIFYISLVYYSTHSKLPTKKIYFLAFHFPLSTRPFAFAYNIFCFCFFFLHFFTSLYRYLHFVRSFYTWCCFKFRIMTLFEYFLFVWFPVQCCLMTNLRVLDICIMTNLRVLDICIMT